MKQYNIYSGLGGSFGGANYQYTGLYETEEEAEDDAFQAALGYVIGDDSTSQADSE